MNKKELEQKLMNHDKLDKKRKIPYKQMPEGQKPKCEWLGCAGGMGLAGNGYCSFRGDWSNKNCPYFIVEKEFWGD